MLKDSVKDQGAIEKALAYVKNLNYDEIKAKAEGYEQPATLKMQDSEIAYTPDLTASKGDAKFYFEIADRTEDKRQVQGKWKLLSTLAEMKGGKLRVLVPYGSMKFANDVLGQSGIEAEIVKLSK